MYLPPVGIIENIETKGEPSTKGGQEVGNKEGEKEKVMPSQPSIKVESFDPRAEEKKEAYPYKCMPKCFSFQWQPPFWSRVPDTLCRKTVP